MNAAQWIAQLHSGAFDQTFFALYGHEADRQTARYRQLIYDYVNLFGPGELHLISAPGRTELAGNHTDHQHGRVLCAAIGADTLAAVAPAEDVHIFSQGFGEITLSLADLEPAEAQRGTTVALVRGVAEALRSMGYVIGGFHACITSDVPTGGGLSSSAAFEILMGAIFSHLYNGGNIPPLQLAEAGYQAENRHFGKPCGRMDQMACALGGIRMIDFAQPTAPSVVSVPDAFSAKDSILCVVNTGTDHADLTDDYASIPRDMAAVAACFQQPVLRYVNYDSFCFALPQLESTLSNRALSRASHFFEEDRRVPEMTEALQAGDIERYRQLMQCSGNSSRYKLQNVVPVSHPDAQDMARMLDRCGAILGERGACRVHGGGFAGYIQCLVPTGLWESFCKQIPCAQRLHIRPVGVFTLGEE